VKLKKCLPNIPKVRITIVIVVLGDGYVSDDDFEWW